MTPFKYRSDTAGEPFEAGISRHGSTCRNGVCLGQTVFSRALQHWSTLAGEFELYYDL